MTLSPIEKRIRWSGILIAAGLVVLLVSLLWAHPLAFVVYLVVGCPLILAGSLLFLYSLATKENTVALFLVLLLPLSLSSCGGGDNVNSALKEVAAQKQKEVEAKPAVPAYDPATATARVFGSVKIEGKAPETPSMTIGGDDVCKKNAVKIRDDKAVTSKDNKVRNVIVYVRSGFADLAYPAPSDPVEIDQVGCVYVPHVLTIMKGQKLRIRNSDATFHNVHVMDRDRSEFNIGQAKAGSEDVKTFSRAVMPFKIGCDMHRWMSAYAGVFEHPFHTTSGDTGKYELRLPPGRYEIVAWHEDFGEQVSQVEVKEKGNVEVDFKFVASGEHKGRKHV